MDSPQLFLDDANTLTAIYIYIKIKEMKTVMHSPKLSNKMKRTKRIRQNYYFFFCFFLLF